MEIVKICFLISNVSNTAASQSTYRLSGPLTVVSENNTFLDRMTLDQLIHMSTIKTVLKF